VKVNFFLKLLFLPILTGCASTANIQTSSDYKEYNYTQLKTYAWRDENALENKVDPLVYARIKEAIETELSTKGFQKSDRPDFFINFTVTSSNVYDVNSYVTYSGYAPGFSWRRGGYGFSSLERQTQLDMIRKGTMVIDILEPEGNLLIWRGIAEKRLPDHPYDKPTRDRLIKQAVEQVLSNFPPK
jgi:hypothetical protein